MIQIYKTNTMKDAAQFVTDILTRIDKRNLSVMHTIIVPDRTSLEAERSLLKAIGGSFNVQVRTFRRLAADILPQFNYLSKQSGIMALSGIINDNKDNLICFKKGINSAGFVSNMYDTISMMKYCKISPSQLTKSNLPGGVKAKAKDIATLYQAYLDYTNNRFVDSADKLNLLADAMPNNDFIKKGIFYLFDFDNFSAQELTLVEKLMLYAQDVTVACCASDYYKDKHLYLNDIFNGVVSMCASNGINPVIVSGKDRGIAYTKQIANNLYRYGDVKPIDSNDFVELYCGATRTAEVYALACRIQKYIREGKRFRDIYVVTSDITKYQNSISTIFDEFEIPYFCDTQYVLADHPYSQFIVDYLQLSKNNGRLKNVLNFVKNFLFNCDAESESVYKFENFCLKYNVSYHYDRFNIGAEEKDFDVANAFRSKFNEFYKSHPIPQTAKGIEYISSIRKIIEDFSLDVRNDLLAKKQSEQNSQNAYQVKVTNQAPEKFRQVLLQAEMIIGDRFMTLDEFIKTLSSALESVKISVLPVKNDCVVFANMAKARKHDIKFLALLGANYGAMPIIKKEGGLLSDKNIADLQKKGINVEPQIYVENKRERFSLFQLLCEPTEHLYVSYSANDGTKTLVPSPIVNELSRLFTHKGNPLSLTQTADESVYTRKQGISKIVTNRRRLLDKQFVKMPTFSIFDNFFGNESKKFVFDKNNIFYINNGQKLFLKKSATSVSKITEFYDCPYAFFFKYGLDVRPRTVSDLKTSDLGNILHAVLENYVKNMDENESDAATKQKAVDCYHTVLQDDYYKGITGDKQKAGILHILERECQRLCVVVKNQLKNSKFKNFACELNFAPNADTPAVDVSFDGGKFSLVGKIDRVDKNNENFIVIDYKSGASSAHYNEKLLYIGKKLQLLVYVKAVQENKKLRPVGYYYFNIHDKFTKVDDERPYTYVGRTIEDIDTIQAIDNSFVPNGSSKLLGIKLSKEKNKINKQSKKTLTYEQIQNQVDYAQELIKLAGKLMQKGYVAASPLFENSSTKACDNCDYKDICDFGDIFTIGKRTITDSIDASTIDCAVESVRKGDFDE